MSISIPVIISRYIAIWRNIDLSKHRSWDWNEPLEVCCLVNMVISNSDWYKFSGTAEPGESFWEIKNLMIIREVSAPPFYCQPLHFSMYSTVPDSWYFKHEYVANLLIKRLKIHIYYQHTQQPFGSQLLCFERVNVCEKS